MRSPVLLALLALAGCGEKGTVRPPGAAPLAPAPALALRVSDTISVWFSNARADTAADGKACQERLLEIRAGTRVVPVPLLYTGEIPTITSDSTMRVHIWRHCVPTDLYAVHLRTGQPTRVAP